MSRALCFVLVVGCGFHPNSLSSGDAQGAGFGDEWIGIGIGLGLGIGFGGTRIRARSTSDPPTACPESGDLSLTNAVMIDTQALTISVPLPSGVTFVHATQLGQTTPVAVLHVRKLDIAEDAMVQVVGDEPLIIVAGSDVTIEGTIDAGAQGTMAARAR